MGTHDLPANLRIGTSSFSSDDWVGKFYPEGTRPEQYLARYAERFDTVELNTTGYRLMARPSRYDPENCGLLGTSG